MINTTPKLLSRTLVLLILLVGMLVPQVGTSQDWQWGVHEGGAGTESARKVAVDAAGNSFVASTFFGTLTIGGNTYTSTNTDVVLTKYDLAGALLWAKQLGSPLNDDVTSITPDRNGGVIVAGNFAGATLNLGASAVLANSNAGSMDAYLIRMDGNGTPLWSFNPLGLGIDIGGKTYTDGKTVLFSGHTLSLNIQFGSKAPIANPSFDAAFLTSLDLSTGAVNWGRLFGNGYRDYGDGVVLDKAGNAYMGGMFSSSTLKLDAITLTNANTNKTFDIFVAKFDVSGQCVWAKSAAGTSDDVLTGLSIDGSDNLYFSGAFSSPTISFDGKSQTNGIALEQMLVGSLDASGTVRWLMRPSTEVQGRATDISVMGTDIYVSGYYRGGGLTLNTAMANAGLADGFVAQFNSTGTVTWNDRFGGANDDLANGIAATSCGAVMAGEFASASVSFGTTTLKNAIAGQSDIAVARLARKIAFSIPQTKAGCGPSMTLNAGGGYVSYSWVTGETTQSISVTSSGIYPVRVIDASGCYGYDSTQVSIVNADVQNLDATVCKGTPLKLWVDTSIQTGTLVAHFTHDMSNVWSETIPTINQGRYRLVVSGDWRSITMTGFRLDAANQYFTTTGNFNQKWNGSHTPASFLVNGNAIRPFNDVYRTDHTYEFQFAANSDQTIINYFSGFLTEANGSLTFDLYRINDPVTVSWSPTGEITNLINVIPTATTTYTATITDGRVTCVDKVVVTVPPDPVISLTSPATTEVQSICLNAAIIPIIYSTSGATSVDVTGLPAGLSYVWSASKLTISGTATASGSFSYTIKVTDGCGNSTRTGSINVNTGNTVLLTSATGSDAQAICLNSPLSTISYTTTGATNATITGLPAGVAGKWLANTVTISGTPTVAGSFPYTITLTGGCGNVTATGSLVVTFVNTITLSSAPGTNAQSTCQNSPIQSVVYNTAGATGATVDGLPAGVTANWALNVLTISGTPTASGTFSYTITLTGGCGVVTEKGSIKVNPIAPASVTIATAITSVCAGSNVTFNATPVNPGTTPNYRWQVNFADVFTGGSSFAINTLKDGDQICVIMTSNAQCVVASPAESNIIRMTVNPVPSVTNSTAATNCGPGTMALNATPSAGTMNWFAAATGGTSIGTGASFTTPLLSTTTTYYAEAMSLGCASATRIPVTATVNVLPTPSITSSAGAEICINADVNYATQSGMTGYVWTVAGVSGTDYVVKSGGLGTTDNSVTLTWKTTGNRYVQVNYMDAKGCSGIAARTDLHVNDLPTGTLTAPADLTFCKGDAMNLVATGGATYTWYRNGVADLLNTGSTLSAKEEGNYTVEAINAAGCKAMANGSASISFKALPAPSFTVVPACAGSATEFTNGTTYGGAGTLSFAWDLDDGFKATTADASQIYSRGGSKRIVLTASSSICPNSPVSVVALLPITSARPAIAIGPVDAEAGQPVGLQARTFGQTYSWSPATGLSDPSSDHPDATLNNDASYTVSIKDIGGCVTVDTVKVRVFPGQRIYVPTAFTPNGDGLNDRLHPVLVGFQSMNFFRVYNRFGNLVHETDKADAAHGWDGRYRGFDQPSGTYIWALRATDKNGQVVNKTGSFTLIR